MAKGKSLNADAVTDNLLICYAEEIEQAILNLDDPLCRDVMGCAMNHLTLLRTLRDAPYGLEGTMSYRGGLLVHTIRSLRCALATCIQAQELETPFSPSLVTMGCILRNVGWYTTTNFQGDKPRPRDSYKTIGVRRASIHYINKLVNACVANTQTVLPTAYQQVLENMCNPTKDICTFEGMIVAYADNIADVLSFGVATLQTKQEGNWHGDFFTGHLS